MSTNGSKGAQALAVCSRCFKPKRFVRTNRKTGLLICPACYVRWSQPRLPCSRCGQVGLPALRTVDGVICKHCYRAVILIAPCVQCGRARPVFRRVGTGVMCEPCSDRHYRAPERCGRCGRRSIAKGMPGGQPICGACYRALEQPKRRCVLCAETRIISIRLEGREGVCSRCYFQVTSRGACDRCRSPKRLLRSTNGSLCLGCFRASSSTLAMPPASRDASQG
jgi:hypothetical protein